MWQDYESKRSPSGSASRAAGSSFSDSFYTGIRNRSLRLPPLSNGWSRAREFQGNCTPRIRWYIWLNFLWFFSCYHPLLVFTNSGDIITVIMWNTKKLFERNTYGFLDKCFETLYTKRKNGSFWRLRGNLIPTVKTCSDNAGVGKTQREKQQVYSCAEYAFFIT